MRRAANVRRRSAQVWKRSTPLQDNTPGIQPGDILLFAMFRNERHRLAPFVQYYRALGVGHFIFADNDSEDGGLSGEPFAGAKDISVFKVTQRFGEARQGTDWINAFLNRFCCGHWTLVVDIDEFFVFPHSERRTLADLVTHLTDAERQTVWSLLVDMYPRGPIERIEFTNNVHPLSLADQFDAHGYYGVRGGFEDIWMRGGPRLRKFFRDDPRIAPALNKVPLIKWQLGYEYLLNQHVLFPHRLNWPHGWHNQVTGALLHFKFDRGFSFRVQEEVARKEHYAGGGEYRKYLEYYRNHAQLNFVYPGSRPYSSTKSLMEAGLLCSGIWS